MRRGLLLLVGGLEEEEDSGKKRLEENKLADALRDVDATQEWLL
jgi:hypothetical protein